MTSLETKIGGLEHPAVEEDLGILSISETWWGDICQWGTVILGCKVHKKVVDPKVYVK